MANLDRQLRDWRLTTADIIYRLPDHPVLLQEFIWQDYDLAPQFPALNKFLRFWTHEIEGSIHSIIVAHVDLITDGDVWFANHEFQTS